MSPWVNIVLLIPAGIIVGIIILIRIKGKLENKIFHYRHEGLILHTSLVLYRYREGKEGWRRSLGLALLTNERLILFNWNQEVTFNCTFTASPVERCNIKPIGHAKQILIECHCTDAPRELYLNVRNADAWRIEFLRLTHASSE